jgi:peptidoglycan hydrolase-like protein with peptidoglycan-binding domain
MDFRALLNKLDEADSDAWAAERRVQDNGRLTNFNLDRDDPSKLFTNVRDGGDSYSRDDIVKVYYKDDERLSLFKREAGANAVEVDEDGTPVPLSDVGPGAEPGDQTAAEPGDQTPDNGNLRLSNGSEYFRDSRSQRDLNARAGELVRRIDELIRKMNESIPNSLKGYLVETDRSALLFEALTSQEEQELRNAYNDLRAIITFQDEQGYLISTQNVQLLRQRLDDLEPAISSVLTTAPASDADSTDSDTSDSDAAEAPPEAERASDASGDQDATVDPGEGETNSSLEAFARSGKGGLANDPDEVDAITELQQYLTDLGFDPNGVDGKYGRGTIAGVKEFQKYFGAVEDGDAGPETIGKIVKLRSFNFGDGKTFVDFRNDMERMEELVQKSGQDTPAATESMSFRDLINLVERTLYEALSDEEKSELNDLIAQYDAIVTDGEFAAALPKVSYDRYMAIVDGAKEVSDEPAAPVQPNPNEVNRDAPVQPNPNEVNRDAPEEIVVTTADQANSIFQDPDATDAERQAAQDFYNANKDDSAGEPEAGTGAAYKEVTGSGQGRRYRTYDADGNEVSSGRGAGPNLPTQNEYTAQLAQPTGDGPEADGSRAALSQVRPDPADVGQTVEPRPTDSGVQGDYARAAWDRQYAATHNPDGSPKTGAQAEPEAGSPSNDTAEPEATSNVNPPALARAQAFVDKIGNIDNMSEEELDAMLDELIQDEEAFNLLPANLRQQLRDIRG